MLDMAYLNYEQLRVIVLNTKNRVVDNVPLYRGTINSSVLRAAEIFRLAIVRKCPAIIICHSHPSGDPTPSPEDRGSDEATSGGRKGAGCRPSRSPDNRPPQVCELERAVGVVRGDGKRTVDRFC